jgi:chromate transporter
VVGVILNLSIWFGLHVLFADVPTWTGFGMALPIPDPASVRWPAVIISALAMLALLRLHVNLLLTLALCAAAGLAVRVMGGA